MRWQDVEMTPTKLLAEMQLAKAELDGLVGGLDDATMEGPSMYEDLNIKDVLAHIACWVDLEATWLEGSLKGEPIIRFAPGFELSEDADHRALVDGINDKAYQENKDKPLLEITSGFHAAHDRLVKIVGGMSERDLLDPDRFDWSRGEPVWTSIAENSYEHYREHADLIRQGLQQARSES